MAAEVDLAGKVASRQAVNRGEIGMFKSVNLRIDTLLRMGDRSALCICFNF
jgi:hypothetical protein